MGREHQGALQLLNLHSLLHLLCSRVNEVIFGKVGFTAAISVNKERITESLPTGLFEERHTRKDSEGSVVTRVFWLQENRERVFVTLHASLHRHLLQ